MKMYLRTIPIFFKRYYGAFYIPMVTIYFILCAWTYSVSYFKTIGIPISYSPTENLIFIFEKARSWRGSLIGEVEVESLFVIFGFLILVSVVANIFYKLFKKYFKFEASANFSGSLYNLRLIGPLLKFSLDGSGMILSRLAILAVPIWIMSTLNFSVLVSLVPFSEHFED